MDVVIGMVLAFLLGAYIREPFAFKERVKEETKVDDEILSLLKEEQDAEKKRQIQIYKALQWNGKKGGISEEN